MNYHFFDYKYNIQGFTSDMFSIPHIIFIALSLVGVPIACYFLRKADHKKIDLFLKIFSICFLAFEIIKVAWESYYDISTGRGFNKEGLIPVYTCSIFIYTMLCAGWGKGKIKDCSLAFLTTIGLVSGIIGIVYCRGLAYYPFWTFGGFYSLLFHFSMYAVGMFLLFTRYKTLGLKDMIRGWFPLLLMSFISTPINYTYGADYMQTYNAGGVPLLSNFADLLAAHNLRWLFTIIMIALYIPMAGAVVGLTKLVYLATDKIKGCKNKAVLIEGEDIEDKVIVLDDNAKAPEEGKENLVLGEKKVGAKATKQAQKKTAPKSSAKTKKESKTKTANPTTKTKAKKGPSKAKTVAKNNNQKRN